jgi:peptide deformylase
MCLINPKIIKFSRETSTHSEGCLSIPKVHGRVTRPEFVCVRYTDLQNRQHEIEGQGILARCMQHEIDHLHGILFTDRIVP